MWETHATRWPRAQFGLEACTRYVSVDVPHAYSFSSWRFELPSINKSGDGASHAEVSELQITSLVSLRTD